MTAKEFTQTLRSYYGLKTSRSKRSKFDRLFIAQEIHRPAKRGDLPLQLNTAVEGIEYAFRTGRLNGSTHMAIRAMNCWQYSALVGEVAANVSTMNDAVYYLQDRRF
jgi:hypothetical protein